MGRLASIRASPKLMDEYFGKRGRETLEGETAEGSKKASGEGCNGQTRNRGPLTTYYILLDLLRIKCSAIIKVHKFNFSTIYRGC